MLRFVIAIAVSLLALPAFAQTAAPTAGPIKKDLSLGVTTDEAQTLLNALSEKPWKDVNGLMQKLFGQANAQLRTEPAPQKTEALPATPPVTPPADEAK